MTSISFSWDAHKDLANRAKHGAGFKEARSVFYDDSALLIPDPDHSELEDRFILLGMSSQLRILVVCHCYRKDSVTRIFSARKASQKETELYLKGRQP